MTITVNNNVEGNPGGAASSATTTISVSSGHTIVALVQYNDFGGGGSITSVTDSSGANTYTLRKTLPDGLGRTFLVFDCIGIANAVTSVTANASNSAGFPSVVAFDLSSANTIAYSDSNGTAYVNNNPSTTNGVTTGTLSIGTASTGALVGICSDFGNGANISIGTGFTAGSTLFGNPYAEYKTTTVSAAITYTDSVANGQVLVIGGLYVEAAVAPTVTGAWQRIRPLNPPGASPGKFGRFYQSPKSYNIPAVNVTVALTGQQATFTAGTLTPSSSVPLTGQSAAGTPGSVVPSLSVALVGASGTLTAGTLSPSTTVALLGSLITGTAGIVVPSGGTGGDVTIALTGQRSAFAQGTLGVSISVALAGASSTGSAGTLSPGTSAGLLGSSATTSTGTLGVGISPALVGTVLQGTPGTLQGGATFSLTGNLATFSLGILNPSLTVPLTGITNSTNAGQMVSSGGDLITTQTASMLLIRRGFRKKR